MNTSAQESRLPFSADLVRSKGVNLSQQLEMLTPFAETFAERVGAALSGLGGVPVKVSVVSTTTEKLKPHMQAEPGFNIVSETGSVGCWNKSEPDFDILISEVFMGGLGGNRRDDNIDRPATAFDKKLRTFINEKIVRAASDALCEIGEHSALEVQPRARIAPRKAEAALLSYNIKLLLNAFDGASEYDIFLSFDECLKLIGGAVALDGAVPSSASELIEKTKFSVEVYLKPDTVDVRQILNLVPGEILKLNIAASTPVELRLNGQKLTYGMLSFDASGGKVRLLENSPPLQAYDAQHTNFTSVVQNGN